MNNTRRDPASSDAPHDTGTTDGVGPIVAGDAARDVANGADTAANADILTTNQGVAVGDNQHSLKAGLRGPTLLEDFILREKITHFDHERIPERVVHARGSAAHGVFEAYAPMTHVTRAAPFAHAGKRTPVFVRFSTVAGERGSSDTARDVRGFAVKFYTDEGIWDLVGNNIPVFFIQDAIKFPDLVHAVKPEPHHGMPQAASAHDTFWDFASLKPETNRTHRKLLVVDGRLGFTGGVGVAPQWTGHAQDPDHWRDTHFEVQGPVVAQMQSVFIDNWIKVTGDVLHGPRYFPVLAPSGQASAQVFSSSPSGGSESMQLMYLLAITAASKSIDLSAAYFVPDALTLQALTDALQRGVKLRIVLPGPHIDSDTVRGASRATWGSLLAAGATIAEYQPTMYHCKVLIVDGLLTSVGSTNFDNRSFRLNDEATLNIVDRAFASAQTATFEADLALSRPVTHAQWLARPLRERFGDWLASVMGTQL